MTWPRAHHTAWTPSSLPNSIVLFGGVGSDGVSFDLANNAMSKTTERLPGVEVKTFLYFLESGGETFDLKRDVFGVCGIPEKETIILTGGGDRFVTRWERAKTNFLAVLAFL